MGDRWYMQQQSKPTTTTKKRKLKKDIIAQINEVLDTEIDGLEKCTIATLEDLLEAVRDFTGFEV